MEEKEMTPTEALQKIANIDIQEYPSVDCFLDSNEENYPTPILLGLCYTEEINIIDQALKENAQLKGENNSNKFLMKEWKKIIEDLKRENEELKAQMRSMVSIEKVKEIVENEKCKVCDSEWYKGCRCARNKIITELDKLKGE